jgi:scyllo-inositol 2-dehydrogenase (NAD+)
MAGPHLRVGLVGLGRLGRIYARDLATRIRGVRLTAVADTNAQAAEGIAREYDIPHVHTMSDDLIHDANVDAVVVASPTHTHRDIVIAAAGAKKPTFCEKPLALSLIECRAMQSAVVRSGTFFQMGLMRRFDPGYVAAKAAIVSGRIGEPLTFRSSSRDPFLPSLDYVNPATSGGILVDMAIHDFDLARWFIGDVETVSAIGATLAFPELKALGDFDNAIATMVFTDGRLGVVDVTRNGYYGYDITTEVVGTAGTVRVGYIRETPLVIMTKNNVAHDTVPYFPERFGRAYIQQLENFAQNVLTQTEPPVTMADGIEALRVSLAATEACRTGQPVAVRAVVG